MDDVNEGRGLLADDVLGQLRDGVHVGAVNKPWPGRVQSCTMSIVKVKVLVLYFTSQSSNKFRIGVIGCEHPSSFSLWKVNTN